VLCCGFIGGLQHVGELTHRNGHTLNLLITTNISNLHVGGLFSDHAPVYSSLCATRVAPLMQQETHRVLAQTYRRVMTTGCDEGAV